MSEDQFKDPQADKQGFVLVWVLGSILVLASILAPFAVFARLHVLTTANIEESYRYDLLADGLSTVALANTQNTATTANQLNGRRASCKLDNYMIAITLQDHSGLIDLNGAPEALLGSGFQALGFDINQAGALAQAVLRYRDRSLRSNTPVEEDFPQKFAPFEAVVELKEFPSLNALDTGLLIDLFTVHARQGTVSRPLTPAPLHGVLVASADGETEDSERTFLSGTLTARVEIWSSQERLLGYSEKVVSMDPESDKISVFERRQRRMYHAKPDKLARVSCRSLLGIDSLG